MKLYLYSKSGHSIGLDATRRCAAVASLLEEFDPILCTSDFRAGAYAKEELGIKKYVSVDLLSNLPNMMQRGDILIYDSDETNDVMEKHMRDFCSLLYKIGEDIPKTFVNNRLLNANTSVTKYEKAFFFGDDDYQDELLKLCENGSKHELPLLLGHYFFLGNDKKLSPYFSSILEEEEYIDVVSNTKYLLSGSINACIESVACGNKPVFYKREDKTYLEMDIITHFGIPIITGTQLDDMLKDFYQTVANYPQLKTFTNENLTNILYEISTKLNAH
ncbi:MAG: hypothetical protein ACNI3C_04835 [Candidatus Marinarcus sp.]|uniref:hypothetical protein n=1 Tax=Candidatus Marinarcus sp. TaxID=3100987 RepID=UPI003B0095B8